jgi:predicted nucleic acid-binding protein
MKATGTWIALLDPREKKEDKPLIYLSKEAKASMEEDKMDEIKTNILEVHSVGERLQDKSIVKGSMVIVDPRIPFAVVHDSKENAYLMIQENQVMMVN